MVRVWVLATLLSVLLCRRVSSQPGLFTLMALLLGPGAIPLARKATARPEQAQCLAVVALLGGLSTTLFILSQTVLLTYADLFMGMSLALPIPTYEVMRFIHVLKSGSLGLGWILLNCCLPGLLYDLCLRWLALDCQDEEELATELLWNWAKVLPLLALTTVFFSVLAFALLAPMEQLVGWIGG